MVQRTQQFINLTQLRQWNSLERHSYEAARKELNCLVSILPIAHIAALDGDHPKNSEEYGRFKISVGWETDSDNSSTGSHVARGLLKRKLGDSD